MGTILKEELAQVTPKTLYYTEYVPVERSIDISKLEYELIVDILDTLNKNNTRYTIK